EPRPAVRAAAGGGLGALRHADQRPVPVRLGNPSGRRCDWRTWPQCGQTNPENIHNEGTTQEVISDMTQTATRPALRVETSPRWVRGFVNGVPIVDSKRVVVVYGARRGGTYFFPTADVRMDLLRPSSTAAESGEQRFTLTMDGRTIEDIAWIPTELDQENAQLRDFIAFEWPKIDAWYEEDDEVFVHP